MPVPEMNNEDQVAAKRDEQESGWDGIDQWDKLWSTKVKVELVRTFTQERRGRTTVLRHCGGLQKDEEQEGDQRPLGEELLREREKQGRVEELECSQGSSAGQRVLVWECVGLMCLLARGDLMMISLIIYNELYKFKYSLTVNFFKLINKMKDKYKK